MGILDKLLNEDVLTSIDNMIINGMSQDIFLKNPSFPLLYHLSNHRKNVIDWFDFDSESVVIHIGSGSGIITQSLADKCKWVVAIDSNQKLTSINRKLNSDYENIDWVCEDELKFIQKYENQVDYVVVDYFIELSNNLEELLHIVDRVLRPDGKIIIISFNKFGLRYFSGENEFYSQKLFEGIEGYCQDSSTHTYSKNEYANKLTEVGFKFIKYYYPYPDHLFTETIYSDEKLPTFGDLNNNNWNFESDRIELFDESKVYNELINSSSFPFFSNSFFIISSKEDFKINSKYSKFSRERKEDYQILTSIINDGENKFVVKKPLTDKSIIHLERMYNYYKEINRSKKYNNKIRYCPVKIEEDRVIFDFIYGRSLETLIKECIIEHKEDELTKYIEILIDVIDLQKKEKFKYSNEFKEVFGDIKGLEDLEAVSFPNIDLIPDNLIIDASGTVNIIDYEWVYNFLVPKTFIIFRSLFHSKAFNLLSVEKKDELYIKYGILDKLKDVYLQMEINFQKYISGEGNKMSEILDKMNNLVIRKDMNIFKDIHIIKVYEDNLKTNEIKLSNNISDYILITSIKEKVDEIKILLCSMPCIVKIKSIVGIKDNFNREEIDFKTNATLIENNNYYFDDFAQVYINNRNYDKVEAELLFYYVNDRCIANIIKLTKANIAISNDKIEYQNKLAKYNNNFFVKVLKKLKFIKE
ncbi:MAG: class I SAM-dependent methyltransferase [Thomasclavelia sp.]|uniref:class I SAM-dependent methyltransferase n=1 Tax=Thomasclavelia sp. TaxID=3025757 RepID=UPI00399F28E4